jgi:hypothetical protein
MSTIGILLVLWANTDVSENKLRKKLYLKSVISGKSNSYKPKCSSKICYKGKSPIKWISVGMMVSVVSGIKEYKHDTSLVNWRGYMR